MEKIRHFFVEPFQSARDKSFGNVVVTKTTTEVFRYWFKYVAIFTIIPILLFLATVIYTVPQLPKFVRDTIPEGAITIANGKLTSTLEKPLLVNTAEAVISIDPKLTAADMAKLSQNKSGIFLTESNITIHASPQNIQSIPLSDVPDITVSRSDILSWVTKNQNTIALVLLGGTIGLGILGFGLYLVTQIISLAISAFFVWLVVKSKSSLVTKSACFRLLMYPTSTWLIIDTLGKLTPFSPLVWIANQVVYLIIVYRWIQGLKFAQTQV